MTTQPDPSAARLHPVGPATLDGLFPAMWVHCTPDLLDGNGQACSLLPRRACGCDHGGSHDHLITDWDHSGEQVQASIRALRDRFGGQE